MDAKRALATGAAGVILAAGGAVPALAGSMPATALSVPVGSVFSGTVEQISSEGIRVERKQRKSGANPLLVSVDTDAQTVVSKGGQPVSLEDLAPGAEVIVSGTKTSDGGVLASKILVRN